MIDAKRWVLSSIAHFGIAVAALLFAFASSGDIDGGPTPVPESTVYAIAVFEVLSSPGRQLWEVLQPPGTHLPDAVEQLVFLGNSIAWGGAVSCLIGAVRKNRRSNV